jgi:hypothetical protein
MDSNEYYYKKYLKYKKKYVELKKNSYSKNEVGGFNFSSIINSIGNMGMNMFMTLAPSKYKNMMSDILNSGLVTNENGALIREIFTQTSICASTHPETYSIVIGMLEQLGILVGSSVTLTVPIIIQALSSLYVGLQKLKVICPEVFRSMVTFLMMNKSKILKIVNTYGHGNQTMNNLYMNMFENMITV